MTPRFSGAAFGISVAFATAVAGCGETTTPPTTQRNFDRPIDLTFACYGPLRITPGSPASDAPITAQPTESCLIRSGAPTGDPPTFPVPPGQEGISRVDWKVFILQSVPGTVMIAEYQPAPPSATTGSDPTAITIRDADPLAPGVNGISLGEDPVGIATDRSGCFVLSANAGSCDMSALNVNSALDQDHSHVQLERFEVKNAAGAAIRAKPTAIVMDQEKAAIGGVCPAVPTGIAYVAYPSCHLVAAVDLTTQTIVAGISYDAAGTATITDGMVTCPDECGLGGSVTAGPRPVAVDLEQDPRTGIRRLVIGSDNSPALTLVELDASWIPMSLLPILLQDTGALGTTAVAITPQIGMGGFSHTINDETASGGQFQFVYAIGTDDTVRVAEILTLNRECDTQVDPRIINDNRSVRELSCFAVGDPLTPARRPGARGPGIELPGKAIPTSIEVFKSQEVENDTRLDAPTKLVGYYAVVGSSTGASFVVNIDDDDAQDLEDLANPLAVTLPLAIAHQLRDDHAQRDLTNFDGEKRTCEDAGPEPAEKRGGPRAIAAPTRNIPAGTVAPEKATELPMLRHVECVGADLTRPVFELGWSAPDLVRDLGFPDLRTVSSETWTLTWEGSLSLAAADSDVDGPAVRIGQTFIDATGVRLVDQSRPFCEAGVEPYDIVQFRGCNPTVGDAECPLGYTCYVHPETQISNIGGVCMLRDEADRLANACKDFLTSLRRFTVDRSASGTLTLVPRKHVLGTTPLDGCIDDAQCEQLADYAAQVASSAHPSNATTTVDPRTWSCRSDPQRAPLTGPGQTGMRCIEVCSDTEPCSAGHICRDGMCMEGVTPPQACVNAPQRYELRASDAFTVVGNRSGYVHPIIADATGNCVRDAMASPYLIGRMPLSAPACDPTADPRSGRRLDGTYEPNPCSLMVDHSETQPRYLPGTCTADDPSTMLAIRQAPAIRFRNRSTYMHLVDPVYPGDASCIRDRGGALVGVPLVRSGYQLVYQVTGGFGAIQLPIIPVYPVKVIRGPNQSIWVIDDGDFFATTLGGASTRGRVFRVEIQRWSNPVALE